MEELTDNMKEVLEKIKEYTESVSSTCTFNFNEPLTKLTKDEFYNKWADSINNIANDYGYEVESIDFHDYIADIKFKPKSIVTIDIDLNIL